MPRDLIREMEQRGSDDNAGDRERNPEFEMPIHGASIRSIPTTRLGRIHEGSWRQPTDAQSEGWFLSLRLGLELVVGSAGMQRIGSGKPPPLSLTETRCLWTGRFNFVPPEAGASMLVSPCESDW